MRRLMTPGRRSCPRASCPRTTRRRTSVDPPAHPMTPDGAHPMHTLAKARAGTFLARALALACAALLAGALPAVAQFAYTPAGTAGLAPVAPSTAGFRYSPTGWGGWGGTYIQSPANGYLTGMADLTSATGQYWIQTQQASQEREKTRQMSIDTRRKLEEERKWELANTP